MPSFFRVIRILVGAALIFYVYHHFSTRYKDPVLTLKVPSSLVPTVFHLYNQTNEPLWLDIADHSKGMQAGYASAIDPHHYNIFYLSKGQIAFVCYQGSIGTTNHKISCGDALKVGVTPSTSVSSANIGNYWVVENAAEPAH